MAVKPWSEASRPYQKQQQQKELYIFSFGIDYAKYGHDKTPREKEAETKSRRFEKFWIHINNVYGKNA